MNLNLKDVNDLYYIVGTMMKVDKKDRIFISDEELEVLGDKLRELIETKIDYQEWINSTFDDQN
jgi:hypothetical protein